MSLVNGYVTIIDVIFCWGKQEKNQAMLINEEDKVSEYYFFLKRTCVL